MPGKTANKRADRAIISICRIISLVRRSLASRSAPASSAILVIRIMPAFRPSLTFGVVVSETGVDPVLQQPRNLPVGTGASGQGGVCLPSNRCRQRAVYAHDNFKQITAAIGVEAEAHYYGSRNQTAIAA